MTEEGQNQMTPRSTVLYCQKRAEPDRLGHVYRHFYPHPDVVRTCGVRREDIVCVRVEEALMHAGCFWAWWDNVVKKFKFVYGFREAVTMCFPYGPEAEEALGRGHLLPVRVTEVQDGSSRARERKVT